MIKTITEHTWYTQYEDDVLNHDLTAAIVFTAEWCESCHRLIEYLEKENFNIDIFKINVDECTTLSDDYNVTTLPTTVIFQNGGVSTIFSNNVSIDDIIHELKELR